MVEASTLAGTVTVELVAGLIRHAQIGDTGAFETMSRQNVVLGDKRDRTRRPFEHPLELDQIRSRPSAA